MFTKVSIPMNEKICKDRPFIRIADAKELFGLTPREAWNLLAQKKINGSKDGNIWKLDTDSIFKYYKKHLLYKEA